MRNIFTLVFSFLLLTGCGTSAEEAKPLTLTNYGVSAFAIAHDTFPCTEFLNAMEQLPEWRLSTLWNTFGNNLECLDLFLANNKTKLIQIHAVNEVCQRNNRCEPHEFLYEVTKEEYSRALEIEQVAPMFSIHNYFTEIKNWLFPRLKNNVECLISPGLESNITNFQAATNLINLARSVFGERCQIVWNSLSMANRNLPADYFETHGIRASTEPPCIRNLDGDDIEHTDAAGSALNTIDPEAVPDWLHIGSACKTNFIWSRESNCLTKNEWEPPLERACNGSRWRELIGLLVKNPHSIIEAKAVQLNRWLIFSKL